MHPGGRPLRSEGSKLYGVTLLDVLVPETVHETFAAGSQTVGRLQLTQRYHRAAKSVVFEEHHWLSSSYAGRYRSRIMTGIRLVSCGPAVGTSKVVPSRDTQ